MTDLLAAAGPWPWLLFGRFHPMMVHFPIALLTVAAVLESWAVFRRKPAGSEAAWTCAWVGAASAVVATVMGYSFANMTTESADLQMHERLGLITCVVAALATALAWRARKAGGRGGPAAAYRAFIVLAAVGVGVTGHYGGGLVYGDDLLTQGMPWEAKKPVPPLHKPPEDAPKPVPVAAGQVDFIKDIAPLIKASCLKCHGPAPNKEKGKLRLDTKERAMKKGIKPGKPADSTFYTLLVSTDPDERMPEKADPLPKEKTELVRTWIEQGAPWPDGYEIK